MTGILRLAKELPSGWSAVVSCISLGIGLAAMLGLTQIVHFEWTPTPGLHSWVTEHRYPIQQQIYWFYATILAAPFSVIAGQFLWAAVAGGASSHNPQSLFATSDEAPARESRSRSRSLVLLFVLVVLPADLYFARFSPRIDGSVDLFHDGEQLVPLLEVMRGGVPYRDVYLQHGFLENLGIPWLGANLFSPTLAGVRWMQALVDPLGEVGAYALIVALTGARLLPALLFAVLVLASPVGVSSRAFLGLCSLAVLAWELQRKKDPSATVGFWPCVCSGALATAALLYSTEVGLYTLATGVAFLGITGATESSGSSRTRPLLGFVSGAVAAWVPFALAMAAVGAFDDYLFNLSYQTRYQLEVWGKPFPNLFQTFESLTSAKDAIDWGDRRFWWYACPTLLVASGAWLAHCAVRGRLRVSRFALPLLLLWIVAALFFRSVLGRADAFHIHYAVLFPLLMLVFFADALWSRGSRLLADSNLPSLRRAAGASLLAAAVAVALLPLAWTDHVARRGMGIAHACRALVPSPKRITFEAAADSHIVPESQWRHLNELKDFLAAETAPDEKVLDFTNQAARLYFADRRSATRYFQIVYAALPGMQQEVVDQLEAERTRFALLRAQGLDAVFDGVPYRTRHALVAEYLGSHFSPYRAIGDLQVWKRND